MHVQCLYMCTLNSSPSYLTLIMCISWELPSIYSQCIWIFPSKQATVKRHQVNVNAKLDVGIPQCHDVSSILTLLHLEKPKLHTTSAFLSAIVLICFASA